MNVLLLGSGGREHALAWKLSQSNLCSKLIIAPGNAGTALHGKNIAIALTDFDRIKTCCTDEDINLVVIGPEDPLVNGLVDYLVQWKPTLMVIGPSKQAALLEGSKAYAKEFMQRHNIPTAAYKEFTLDNFSEGVGFLKDHSMPVVLKADGLAAGKGVVICQHHMEAVAELELMIQRSKFGDAGKKVIVEEFLKGIELSVFVLTNGKDYVMLPEAKDYKRVGEGDTGLNTGGMGAISPVPFADKLFMDKVVKTIVEPTIKGLQNDGLDYKGFIFIGLMKVGDEPFVIEYNCRLGDPETEAILPRLQNDLVELLIATASGDLDKIKIETDPRSAATVVAVSGGYPSDYEQGLEITGLDEKSEDGYIFHMGTLQNNKQVLTNGGRVVCTTALDDSLAGAVKKSMALQQTIKFEDKYLRSDIGFEFM